MASLWILCQICISALYVTSFKRLIPGTYHSNHYFHANIVIKHNHINRILSSVNGDIFNKNMPIKNIKQDVGMLRKTLLSYPLLSNTTSRVRWKTEAVRGSRDKKWELIENFFVNFGGSNKINNSNILTPNGWDIQSLNISGRWVSDSGNFLLPPPNNTEVIAVIHFLGGAFVGAAPHLTYRYFLEYLCEKGYLIVATPYRLGFDYIDICDDILTKFDDVGVKLADMYGPLPVIGLGHSCGALLQTLITSLFPDTPRAVNVLLSFNNRPPNIAIPLFEELIIPISEDIMSESDLSTNIRELLRINRGIFNQALSNFADSKLAPRFIKNDILPFI